jgi:ribonuclease D
MLMVTAPTKLEINQLPLRKYEGPVEIVAADEHLEAVLPALIAEGVLGFDIEIKPSFKSSDRYTPALVQLASRETVFLIQLKRLSSLRPLSRIFSDPKVVKAGIAVAEDVRKLREVMTFEPGGFVELGNLAARSGITANGVRTLAAQLLGFRVSKGARCSNWERSQLTPAQIDYAATDAWVCRELFLILEKRPPLALNAIQEKS